MTARAADRYRLWPTDPLEAALARLRTEVQAWDGAHRFLPHTDSHQVVIREDDARALLAAFVRPP